MKPRLHLNCCTNNNKIEKPPPIEEEVEAVDSERTKKIVPFRFQLGDYNNSRLAIKLSDRAERCDLQQSDFILQFLHSFRSYIYHNKYLHRANI
jgi:hypothetical protein